MYYTNEEEVINDMTYNILNTNKYSKKNCKRRII